MYKKRDLMFKNAVRMAMSFHAHFSWSCLQGKKLSLQWFLTTVGHLRIFQSCNNTSEGNYFVIFFFPALHFPPPINHLLCMTLLHLGSQIKPNNFGRQKYQSFVLDTYFIQYGSFQVLLL